jgi:outer membrane murein-binding lipoprotein Lpp
MSEADLRREIEQLKRENESLTAERRKHEEEHFRIFHSKLDGIALDAREVSVRLASMSGEIKAVKSDVTLHHTVLLGNGTPDHGLASRVKQLEDDHKAGRKWKIGIALAAVTGAVEAICHRLGL